MHLRRALELLREKQRYVKAQKCSLSMQTIGYLGYCVSAACVQPDPDKIEAILSWPLPPGTRTEVQRFLGLASYYRNIIPGFAKIAAPLTDLLKKDMLLVWTDAEDKVAKGLISHLTSAPVLALPDFDKHFFLTSDASDSAVGLMLSQQPDESKRAPYYSTRLSSLYPDRVALPSAREGATCGLVGRQKVSTLPVRQTFHGSN